MTTPIEKVTVFVVRTTASGMELLTFEHPFAGVQLPAGTVEIGEDSADAALREAQEETGLTNLCIGEYLGVFNDPILPHQCIISTPTAVYARPDTTSFDWAHFKRAVIVTVEREEPEFTQVTYEEYDQYPTSQYVTYRITGWVPNTAITREKKRYFHTVWSHDDTPKSWTHFTDQHHFRLFWSRFDALPTLVESQQHWLEMWLQRR